MQLSALGSKDHNSLLFRKRLMVWLDSFTPWFDRICFFQLTDFKAVSHHKTVSLVYVVLTLRFDQAEKYCKT